MFAVSVVTGAFAWWGMYTASGRRPKDVARFRAAGFAARVAKPFALDDLLRVIATLRAAG